MHAYTCCLANILVMPLASCFYTLSTGCYKNVGDRAMISCMLTKQCETEERDETQKERDKESEMGSERTRTPRTKPGHSATVPLRSSISGTSLLYWVSSPFFFKIKEAEPPSSYLWGYVSMFWVELILSAKWGTWETTLPSLSYNVSLWPQGFLRGIGVSVRGHGHAEPGTQEPGTQEEFLLQSLAGSLLSCEG